MVDIGFMDKINIIYNFLKSNSLIFLVLLLIIVILLDLLYGNNKKDTKRLYGFIIILILIYTMFNYYKTLFNIVDVYIENIFRIAYFPSIIEYVSMILITIIIQLVSIKKASVVLKNINIWVGIIIEILFIINIIAMNGTNVNLGTITSIYENDLLLSIFQVTGIIFMIWLIINVLSFIVSLYLIKTIEIPKLNNDYE